MKCDLRARGRLKRGFEVFAQEEICFAAMGTVEKGVSGVGAGWNVFLGHGGSYKGGLRCWNWVKYVLWA